MTGLLEGLAVIVTGAGRGLGRHYALAVAAEGAAVVVNDIDAVTAADTVERIRDAGGQAVAEVGSVADARTGELLVGACTNAFGRLDGLINNAAVLNPGLAIRQGAPTVAESLSTNIGGVIHCGSAAMRAMRRAGSGSIVNIVSGAMQGLPDLSLYGATKAAVMGLTYGWALEVAGTGIRVNAVSPLAWTDMSDLMGSDDAFKGGDPAGISPVVTYLLSERSRDVTGQIIRFDGVRLGVVAPPHVTSVIDGGPWDSGRIAAAFAGPLRGALAPAGLAAAPDPQLIVP